MISKFVHTEVTAAPTVPDSDGRKPREERVRFVLPEDIYTEPGVDKKKKGNFTKLSKPKTIASIIKKFK